MKLQALLTALYYLLFSSSAKQINDTFTGPRETRAPKNSIIYHNGYPIEVHGIPPQIPQFHGIQSLATNAVPSKAEPGPKVALQRDKVIIQNENSYLQDSYGNRYFSPPQNVAYKATFPQRYVALQDLPTHFSHPSLEPTRGAQAYTLPQFTFHEQINRPAIRQPANEQVFYDFSKVAQSLPFVLPQQNFNVPIKTHYKIADAPAGYKIAAPLASSDHHPVTFSFHPSPPQHFINFAPEQHRYHSGPNFQTNIQPSSSVLNPKVQFDNPKQHPRIVYDGNVKLHKKQVPNKKPENKPQTHTLQEFKTFDPKFYKPQVFLNPIVPQVQHYLPRIQSVLKYSIIPKPEVNIAAEPEGRSQKEEKIQGPVEKEIQEIVSSPKNKHKIVINEYTSPEKHDHKEEVKSEVIDEEENEESNFNEGYRGAAKGFPAFSYNDDHAKNIFDESSYGEPHYHEPSDYEPPKEHLKAGPEDHHISKYITTDSIKHKQYGDENQKEFQPIPYNFEHTEFTSSKDKYNKPTGKSSSQPERSKKAKISSHSEQSEHEIPYYFGTHKYSSDEKRKPHSKPARYEIDYSKGFIDRSENQKYTDQDSHKPYSGSTSSRFVEPQYHYGFEPILSSQDSEEQVSSASNIAHRSEDRPNTMKKVYKDNWFISKTSSSQAEKDS